MYANLKVYIFLMIGISASLSTRANVWRSYLSYYQIIAITQGNQNIFAASESGLFSYNLSDNSFETWSRVEGLSDSGISAIGWSVTKEALIIGYSNGNLDVIVGTAIHNLPDIKIKTSITNKSINNIFCEGDFVWLSCDFGIVKINLKRWEVAETWFIGPEGSRIKVNEMTADEHFFWAATESGVFKAERINPNLQDYHSWILQDILSLSKKQFNSIALFNKRIYTCDNEKRIYSFDGISWTIIYPEITGIKKIRSFASGIAFVCDNRVEIVSETSHTKISDYDTNTVSSSKIHPTDIIIANSGNLWIGDYTFGLMRKKGDSQFISVVPSSPADNYSRRLTLSGNSLYVATGLDDAEAGSISAEIHCLKDQNWFSINLYNDLNLSGLQNITTVVASPENPDHFWGSTREDGLVEFAGQKSVKIYNSSNSPLESINGVCKIGGISYDANSNLWITNPMIKNQLHVIKPDGTWRSFSYPGIDNQFDSAGDLIITKTGTKWIIVNHSALFALRTGNSPDNSSTGLYRKTSVRSRFSNGETTVIKGFNEINIIAEDHDGYIWVGTENGIVLYSDPEAIFVNNGFYGIQPAVDLGDGLFHPLLENVTISAIAVDGGNRKWFGSTNSGVFLFSGDGSKLIRHFNTDNSPLFSNRVTSIAVNSQNGEVFFATERGLISWMGDATEGKNSYDKLYVWPNPVRETYSGDITIDGLTDQSVVKITNLTGNLVYETISNGGRAIWDGKNRDGKRVNTGVYLIFCSDREGNQSRVIKLLFIH